MSPACRSTGGEVGGDPGPHTALGVFLGIKAAVKRTLGKDSLAGLHVALQGAGSVAGGVALPRRGGRRAADRRRRRRRPRAERSPTRPAATVVAPEDDHGARSRRVQPQRARRDPRRETASPRSTRRSSPAAPTTSSPRPRTATRLHAARHPLRARLRDQRRRDHQRLHRISAATATRAVVRQRIEAHSRRGSSRSGPRATRPAATRPRSPTRMAQRLIGR